MDRASRSRGPNHPRDTRTKRVLPAKNPNEEPLSGGYFETPGEGEPGRFVLPIVTKSDGRLIACLKTTIENQAKLNSWANVALGCATHRGKWRL